MEKEIKDYKLLDLVFTDLGKMTIKEYLDKCIKFGATFWKTNIDNLKTQKAFIGLNGRAIKISLTQYNYLIKEYKKSAIV